MKTILVIGATGLLGQAVAKQLKQDGFNVQIASRDLTKARSIFDSNFEFVSTDVYQAETLEKAMEGVDAIHINLSGEAQGKGTEQIVEAAKKQSIKQIGFVSGCTVRKENAWHPMIKNALIGEEAIINSGIPYSIFKPTMVLDLLPRYANNGKPFIIGEQPHQWSWIYSKDLAKMAAIAFQKEEARNKKFTIFGPEKASIPEAIDKYNKVFFPKAKPATGKPYWMTKLLAIFIGKSFKYVIGLFQYFDTHPEEGDPSEANKILGKPETTIDTFIEICKKSN